MCNYVFFNRCNEFIVNCRAAKFFCYFSENALKGPFTNTCSRGPSGLMKKKKD